ncbi:MAG: nucleotidyltransferase family protein, partial [Deltaproteobacteria bacterium]|nr:nucleotidyltransferase family protein [Deltaproteobacteria bacterium]
GESRLKTLSSSDWDVLIVVSGRYGVAPLLYHCLKASHSDAPIPANAMGRLRQAYLNNVARNIGLYQELGKVLEPFRRDNISVIALKGVHLATVVYRNLALRPMGDVDLLVKQTDLLRVQEILIEQGYIASKEEIGCAQNHLPPYRKKDSLTVEIHFHIVGPPFSLRVDVEKLWVRAQMSSIQGSEVLTLCPEDLLLHLCMHAGFHHTFDNGIMPLFDISHTIEHYAEELDWEQLLDRGREWGVSKCVYLSLFLAERFAGASIPGQIMKDLDVYNDSFHATARAEELIFRKAGSIAPNVAKLFNNDRLLNRLIHLIRCAFPPKSTLANIQPSAGNPLTVYFLYFFRIIGLLKRHRHTVWRLFLHDRELSTLAIFTNKRNTLKDWLTRTTS